MITIMSATIYRCGVVATYSPKLKFMFEFECYLSALEREQHLYFCYFPYGNNKQLPNDSYQVHIPIP